MSVKVGTTIAGTYKDGTGRPDQDHLLYAANAGVWWLFTISSTSDSTGNPGTHVIKSYVSSSADLSTATWTAKTDSPNLDSSSGGTSNKFRCGRSLGCAILSHPSGTNKDIVHVSASIYCDKLPDAGAGIAGHIRATVTATAITWGTWGQYLTGSFNYTTTGLVAGNACGVTGDSNVQVGSMIYHQELDASILTSHLPDTTDTWNAGGTGTGNTSAGGSTFTNMSNQTGVETNMSVGYEAGDTVPPIVKINSIDSSTQVTLSGTTGAAQTAGTIVWNSMTPGSTRTNPVLDNTMANECSCYAFAPLASNKMLVVYHNGGTTSQDNNERGENFTGLNSMKSNQTQAQGLWPSTTDGTGKKAVFASTSTQDISDWCLCPVSNANIYCARRTGNTTLEVRTYSTVGDSWSALGNQPPALTGKVIKAGGGVMSATDGIDMWLFVIDSTDNAIKYCKFTVASGTWDSGWTVVETVDSTSKYLSGSRFAGNGRIGLIYSVTNGASFDTYASQLYPLSPRRFLMGKH